MNLACRARSHRCSTLATPTLELTMAYCPNCAEYTVKGGKSAMLFARVDATRGLLSGSGRTLGTKETR
jgi:hypothetical protein